MRFVGLCVIMSFCVSLSHANDYTRCMQSEFAVKDQCIASSSRIVFDQYHIDFAKTPLKITSLASFIVEPKENKDGVFVFRSQNASPYTVQKSILVLLDDRNNRYPVDNVVTRSFVNTSRVKNEESLIQNIGSVVYDMSLSQNVVAYTVYSLSKDSPFWSIPPEHRKVFQFVYGGLKP